MDMSRVKPKIIDPNVIRKMVESRKQVRPETKAVFRQCSTFDETTIALQEIAKQLSSYNAAIAEKPESSEAYLRRGRLFQHYGEALEYAIEDFTRAIELAASGPDACWVLSPYAYTLRGSCLCYRSLGRSGISKPQRGDYDMAIADFTKAMEVNPNYRMAYFERADCYERHREIEKAKRDFEKLLAINEGKLREATNPEKISQLEADVVMVKQRLHKLLERMEEKGKKSLLVRKYVRPEILKGELGSKGLKYSLFFMHERDLSQYPWIKKAIMNHECAVPLGLSEQEIKQFYKMSAGTSAIVLPVTRNGIHADAVYLLKLI
jgi:tetratricopeptide (TPR) repeat protein